MNLNVNQVMKIVIDNTIIPDMTEELEFYKSAYANAQRLVNDYGQEIGHCPCKKCFSYCDYCYECDEWCCEKCKGLPIKICPDCNDLYCGEHDFIDNICKNCYEYKNDNDI